MKPNNITHHKFIKELEEYECNPLIGNFNILVVGTFNPDIEKNKTNWFYGRSGSEFWYLLPKALGFDSLYPSDLGIKIEEAHIPQKKFCKRQKIIIVDVFKSVKMEVEGYRDNELQSLKKNEYVEFDYKKSFANTNFSLIVFTWKSRTESHLQNKIRTAIIDFFQNKKTPHLLLDSPSPSHQIGRYDKLVNWKEALNPYLCELDLKK